MKKILLKYFNLFALSGLLLAFVGCSDDNDSITPGPDVEEMPSIGTYSFRGEANKIVTGVASVDGDYLTCVLSPEKMDEGKTDTYFCFFSPFVLGRAGGGCFYALSQRPVCFYLRRSDLLLLAV